MDNGTWIYIIISIIFFIVNALTKKKKEDGQEIGEMGDEPSDDQPKKKPLSFEELLREIRQEQQSDADFDESDEQEEIENEPLQPVYEEVKVSSNTDQRKPEIKYYEGTYQADHANKGKGLVKLDDQVEIDPDKKILKEVEEVAVESTSYNRYRRMLKDPQSLRDAVVVSEILKRKEF